MSQSITSQAVRYGMVGVVVFACDFLTYLAVIQIAPSHYVLANLAGRAVGAMLGFVLHRHFTFAWNWKDSGLRQLASYLGLFLGNLLLSSQLLWFLVEWVGMGRVGAKLLVDCFVIGTSFLINRLWVFRGA